MTVRNFANEAVRASLGLAVILGVGAVLPILAVVLLAQAV